MRKCASGRERGGHVQESPTCTVLHHRIGLAGPLPRFVIMFLVWVRSRLSPFVAASSLGRGDVSPRPVTPLARNEQGGSWGRWRVREKTGTRGLARTSQLSRPAPPPHAQRNAWAKGGAVIFSLLSTRKCEVPRLLGWLVASRWVPYTHVSWTLVSAESFSPTMQACPHALLRRHCTTALSHTPAGRHHQPSPRALERCRTLVPRSPSAAVSLSAPMPTGNRPTSVLVQFWPRSTVASAPLHHRPLAHASW